MPRIFLNPLKAAIDARLADNVTGDITPEDFRIVLEDIIDSCTSYTGYLFSSVTQLINATNTPTKITGVWNLAAGDDGTFLKLDSGLGEIVTSTIPGYRYKVFAGGSFIGDNNRRFDFQVYQNGVPFGLVSGSTGDGNNDPVSWSLIGEIQHVGSDDVWDLRISTDGAPVNVTLISCYLALEIMPTLDPA